VAYKWKRRVIDIGEVSHEKTEIKRIWILKKQSLGQAENDKKEQNSRSASLQDWLVETKQQNHDNPDRGIANLSGYEGDLLPSDVHDPILGVSGVKSVKDHHKIYSDETLWLHGQKVSNFPTIP